MAYRHNPFVYAWNTVTTSFSGCKCQPSIGVIKQRIKGCYQENVDIDIHCVGAIHMGRPIFEIVK